MKKLLLFGVLAGLLSTGYSQNCGPRYNEEVFSSVAVREGVEFGAAPQVVDLVGPDYTPVVQTQTLLFDFYEPVGDVMGKRPLLILAFGGAFVAGTRSDAYMVELCRRYAKLGYAVASIDYRLTREIILLAPTQQFPEIAPQAVLKGTHDMKAAVRFFRNSAQNGNPYRINEDQIYVGGLSAGAFCATHVAYLDKDSEIPELIADYVEENGGIEGNSGTPGVSSAVAGVISLSGALGEATWLEAGDVPIVSTHGTADEVVPYGSDSVTILGINYPVDGSSIIHQRADEMEVTNAFYTYQGASHAPESGNGAYLDTGFAFTKTFMYDRVCEYQQGTTSIGNYLVESNLNVYPNPSSDNINIEGLASGSQYEIRNLEGKIIKSGRYAKNGIDVSSFPQGAYMINAYNSKGNFKSRFFKE